MRSMPPGATLALDTRHRDISHNVTGIAGAGA
jgi:hypothetical protein